MSDRYAKIREALEMKPTPGPWEWTEGLSTITREWDGKEWAIASVEHRLGWHENRRCAGLEAGANAALIAACDPDTIRELLAERDELAAENERLREALEFYASQGVYKRDGWSDRPAPVISDGGDKARAALGEVKP